MVKLLTIIGARPQIIKSSAICRAIENKFKSDIREVIVHTGQHYDANMSQVFFDEMGIPTPDYNLQIGSASHGIQTAKMIIGIEELILKEKPDYVLVYGDTNSTLAGAVAASKLHTPLIHVEAGLRSFNKSMPEEINRILCDHVSTLLFSPTMTGVKNLIYEGLKTNLNFPYHADKPGVFHCGDVMYDNSLFFSKMADTRSQVISANKLEKNNFALVTIHRDNNTDDKMRLTSIFSAIDSLANENQMQFFIPLHPRTSKLLASNLDTKLYIRIVNNKKIIISQPVSFFDMIELEKYTSVILTDSGGVQKESYFFQKPCIILRPETEWVEIVEAGTAVISDANTERIVKAFQYFQEKPKLEFPLLFGDGKAAEFICEAILKNIEGNKVIK